MARDSTYEAASRAEAANARPISIDEVRAMALGVRVGGADRMSEKPAVSVDILLRDHPGPYLKNASGEAWYVGAAYRAGLIIGSTRGVRADDIGRFWRGEARLVRENRRARQIAALAGVPMGGNE